MKNYYLMATENLEREANRKKLEGCWNSNGSINRSAAIEQLTKMDEASRRKIIDYLKMLAGVLVLLTLIYKLGSAVAGW